MVEKDMQSIFTKHVKTHLPTTTEAYELKICKGTSMPYNQLQPHQEQALLAAEADGFYHRITDQPWLPDRQYAFTAKKPFDCFALVGIKAFVVIWFYKERQKKVFIKIRIHDFLTARDNSKRKSITEIEARAIGELLYP